MHNHEPVGYDCPFCNFTPDRKPDVVHRDERVFAIISPRWWPRNAGHLLIIPRAHHENVYDLPDDDLYATPPQPDWLPADRRAAHAQRLRAALTP